MLGWQAAAIAGYFKLNDPQQTHRSGATFLESITPQSKRHHRHRILAYPLRTLNGR